MKRRLWYSILIANLTQLTLPAFAQQTLPDSVQHKLVNLPSDSARSRYLNNLAWKHKANQPDYSESLCRYSLSISEKNHDCYATADAMGILGNISDNHARFTEAISFYKKAYQLAQQCGILNLKASNLNNMGLVFQRQQRYDSANYYLTHALELKKKMGNRASLASTLNNLGLVKYQQLHYREALHYFLESLKIKEEFNDRKSQGSTLLNVSNIYKELGIRDSALRFVQRSILIRTEFADYLGLASSFNNLALLKKESGKFEEALLALNDAEKYAQQVGDNETLAKIANNRSDVYLLKGQINLAKKFAQKAFEQAKTLGYSRTGILALNNLARSELADNKPEEAIAKLELAMHFADSANDIVGRKETLKNLVAARAKASQQPEALATFKAYQQLNDSVVYKNLAEELAGIQQSYEVLKAREEAKQLSMKNRLKDAELLNAQLKERQNYWIILGLFLLLILLAVGLVIYLRLKRERDRQKLQTARLEAREQERKRISSDIHDELGTHLSRIALSAETALLLQADKGQQQDVLTSITRLSRETIANLSDLIWYMNPEHSSLNPFFFRVREQLSDYLQELPLDYDITLELKEEVNMHPELLRHIHLWLKEAVHNAVKHAQATHLLIEVKMTNGYLTLTVADNGKGFDALQANKGNGLKNLQLRSNHLNGKLEITSKIGEGTRVELKVHV